MKRIVKIDVPGRHGYSFAVAFNAENEIADHETAALDLALEANLFEEDEDYDYATAEDITDSEYDLEHFKNCTYEV
jgi:hypothetical protein